MYICCILHNERNIHLRLSLDHDLFSKILFEYSLNSHPKLRLVQDFICEILRDWPNVVELVSNPFVNLLIDNFINVISL